MSKATKNTSITTWYRKQSVGVKAAILGGLFLVFATILPPIISPILDRMLPENPIVIKMEPTSTPSIGQPILQEIGDYGFNIGCIYAWDRNINYEPPTSKREYPHYYYARETWAVHSNGKLNIGGTIYALDHRDISGFPRFLLLTPRTIIIKKITLFVDKFNPPPPVSELQLAGLRCNFGSGSIPGIDFKKVELNPSQDRYRLFSENSKFYLPYQLDANGSIAFNVFLSSRYSGEYIFHVEIEATDYDGKDIIISTPSMHFRQIHVPIEELQALPAVLRE